jgi:hypothetical protein
MQNSERQDIYTRITGLSVIDAFPRSVQADRRCRSRLY